MRIWTFYNKHILKLNVGIVEWKTNNVKYVKLLLPFQHGFEQGFYVVRESIALRKCRRRMNQNSMSH